MRRQFQGRFQQGRITTGQRLNLAGGNYPPPTAARFTGLKSGHVTAGGALFMEVYDRGRAVIRLYNVTAYYWLEDSQRGILLYDEKGFRGLDDARTALTQKGVGATHIFRSLIMTSPEDRTGPLTRPAVLETSSGNETPCLPY